jgi:hypothetical protein
MQLCVLIFNAGSENEGIYTLSAEGENAVVAFENVDDAQRYAVLLEAQDFLVPQVESIDVDEIKRFCDESALGLLIIESGQLVVPPEKSKESLDWRPDNATPAESELDQMRAQLEKLFRGSS